MSHMVKDEHGYDVKVPSKGAVDFAVAGGAIGIASFLGLNANNILGGRGGLGGNGRNGNCGNCGDEPVTRYELAMEQAIAAKDKEVAYKKLSVYMSVVDKNAKRGIFHKNKANRLKARATKRVKVAFNELAPVAN